MDMTGSRLSRDTTVVVIVDMQERLAAAMSRRDEVAARVVLLCESASITGCPVILTRQYPQGLGDLVQPLVQAARRMEAAGQSVHRADKVAFDCFAEPDFVAALERTGRTQLLVAGMETHICVTQTTLAGLDRNLNVHVAADACCSREEYAHDMSLMRMSRAGAVITTAESAAYELVGAAGTAEFKALLQAVKA
jgi:nicotinamidase-related amidase